MDLINRNIKFIRKQKGLTQQEFANLIGIKRSSLGAYEEGRAKPNYETIQAISRKYNISIDKLLTVDLAKIADRSVFGVDNNTDKGGAADLEGNKLRVLSITVDRDNNENIELVPEKAAAGYLQGHKDPEFIENLPKFRLPFLPSGTYRAFEIEGYSMLPLQPGAIVIGEYVENWKDIKDGDTYIVLTHDGLVYKRLYNKIKEKNALALHSDNSDPEYKPYEVAVNEIVEVWKSKLFISEELPIGADDISLEKVKDLVLDSQQRMIELQQEVMNIKNKIN